MSKFVALLDKCTGMIILGVIKLPTHAHMLPDVAQLETEVCTVGCCCCALFREAEEWSETSEGCFLKLAEGSSYIDLFRRLRLNYFVTEYKSALVVERDRILPRGVCVSSLSLVNLCTLSK